MKLGQWRRLLCSALRAASAAQVSLADFRRLCILKGVYPRDPKKKRFGKDKVYYHAKDILHIASDPLLPALRRAKATQKKVRRAVGRKEHGNARRFLRASEPLPLQHLVKQRYPTLADAVADLDDALCTAFVLGALPSNKARGLLEERSRKCMQLCDHFLLLVSSQRALRKAFASIKGYYFQAELLGKKVTWLVPHAFAQVRRALLPAAKAAAFREEYKDPAFPASSLGRFRISRRRSTSK